MKKSLLLFFGLLGIVHLSGAQSLVPSVNASGGSSFSNSSGQIDWTLGEPVIATVGSSAGMLSQGFHQPDLSVTTGLVSNEQDGITVYPNPTVTAITIQSDKLKTGQVAELYDPLGKLVYTSVLRDKMEIGMTDWPAGTYLLTIRENNKIVRTCQVIKQ